MTDMNLVLRVIDAAIAELSPEQRAQVIAHIEGRNGAGQTEAPRRKLNLHQGTIWMSDDFDDELPDSFWLGDDA